MGELGDLLHQIDGADHQAHPRIFILLAGMVGNSHDIAFHPEGDLASFDTVQT